MGSTVNLWPTCKMTASRLSHQGNNSKTMVEQPVIRKIPVDRVRGNGKNCKFNFYCENSSPILDPLTCSRSLHHWDLMLRGKSKALESHLVNAEVNSGNRKAELASNYATRTPGRHAALQECIMYKVICSGLVYTHDASISISTGNLRENRCDASISALCLRLCLCLRRPG